MICLVGALQWNFLHWWKCPISVLPSMVFSSHTWLLNTQKVHTGTKKLIFFIALNFNWLNSKSPHSVSVYHIAWKKMIYNRPWTYSCNFFNEYFHWGTRQICPNIFIIMFQVAEYDSSWVSLVIFMRDWRSQKTDLLLWEAKSDSPHLYLGE